MTCPFVPPFGLDAAQQAADSWGANCGPGALAAVLDLSLDQVRPHLFDFERKGYMNPTLMYAALRSLGAQYRHLTSADSLASPINGLVRVQWEGPWTEPGVPIRARYRKTHWIATRWHAGSKTWWVFDINAMCAGGWIGWEEWSSQLVPWLLKECQPRANGRWHFTHRLEIEPSAGDAQ